MRKLVAALCVMVALVLTACGGSSLTSVQMKAIKQVNANIVTFFDAKCSLGKVVGTAQNIKGHTVTVVYETCVQGTEKAWVLLVVDTDKSGKLVYADALFPSGDVVVTP